MLAPRWMDELLGRSRHAPLKLHADLRFQENGFRTLRFVAKMMNRYVM